MGKKWNRKRKKEEATLKASKPRQDRDPQSPPPDNALYGYRQTTPSNAKMEAYYAYQGLHHLRHHEPNTTSSSTFVSCETDEEKEVERKKFMETMCRILPVSFRIGQNIEEDLRNKLAKELDVFVGKEIEILVSADGKNLNKKTIARITAATADANGDANSDANGDKATSEDGGNGEQKPMETTEPNETTEEDEVSSTTSPTLTKIVAPAKKIPYVPNAYQLSVDRRTLRRNPMLQTFHEWLKIQTDAGFITRQETVSMIPPVVLAAECSNHILDMCAAPGSKTSQLLEIVGTPSPNQTEPTGFVVANDSDAKRAYMLVHQLRRLNNPASFLTCVDAQFWPVLNRGEGITTDASRAEEGIFDRVLCDVPCSGDGTARKNPGVWRHWGPLGALGLHPLQLSIALNGARLTKVGGYVCYSTCSMNPIENEAVVAELLRLAGGGLELVDRRNGRGGGVGPEEGMGEGFWARDGWTTWKVMSEAKRRKDVKNEMKKRGKEMQKRKIAWEKMEDEKKLAAANGDENSETKGPVRVWADELADLKAKRMTKNKEQREPWIAAPSSWDEKSLLERAESTGLELYKTFDDVPETQRRRCRESCFPPTKEEIAKFNLDRCMRCLPHDMDTGGFFVALFRKVAPLSERARKKAKALALDSRPDSKRQEEDEGEDKMAVGVKDGEEVGTTENSTDELFPTITITDEAVETKSTKNKDGTTVGTIDDTETTNNSTNINKLVYGKPLLRGRGKSRGNQGNYDFVKTDESILPPLIEFYGLSDSFAREQFMARNSGDAKLLYFITKSVKKNMLDRGVQDRVTVVTSGLRAFERGNRDGVVRYRPCQECIHFVAPHMSKRKIIANLTDFTACLNTGYIKAESFSDDMALTVTEFSTGAFVVALKGFETNTVKKMFLVMWRCRGENGTCNCLVAKMEQEGMKSKLRAFGGGETVGKE